MIRSRFMSVLLLTAALGIAGGSCSSDSSIMEPPSTPSRSDASPASSNLLGIEPLSGVVDPLVEPLSGPVGDALRGITGLLECTPLPYASATQRIGPDGGTLHIGPHTLTIPPGALTESVVIRGEAPVDRVNSVRLLPEGLQFASGKDARLTLSYRNCLGATLLPLKRIVYTTDNLRLLSVLVSADDVLRQRVSTGLKHFSRYAVAW